MTSSRPPDGLIRFRLLDDAGVIVSSVWITTADPPGRAEEVSLAQIALAEQFMAEGRVFTVEVFDPDLPPEHATVRFGTDPSRMKRPIPMTDGYTPGDDYRARLRYFGHLP